MQVLITAYAHPKDTIEALVEPRLREMYRPVSDTQTNTYITSAARSVGLSPDVIAVAGVPGPCHSPPDALLFFLQMASLLNLQALDLRTNP